MAAGWAMGTTITNLFNAIERVLDEGAPAAAERPAGTEEPARAAEAGRETEVQRLLELLCEEYLGADAGGRSAIRAFIERAKGPSLWLMWECAVRLTERVTGPDALTDLRLALAAVSIDNCGVDSRDTTRILAYLYSLAKQAGLDPQPEFEAMAAMSTDSQTPGGCESVAALMRRVGAGGVAAEEWPKRT